MLTERTILEIHIGDFQGYAEGALAICAPALIAALVLFATFAFIRERRPPA